MRNGAKPARGLAARTPGHAARSRRQRIALLSLLSLLVFAFGGFLVHQHFVRSAESPVADSTISPTTPAHLAARNVTAHAITLYWSASSDKLGIRAYLVLLNRKLVASTTATAFTDHSVAPATTYVFQLEAQDNAGHLSLPTEPLAVTTHGYQAASSSMTPVDLSATAVSPTQVILTWRSGGHIPVVRYIIYRDGKRIGTAVDTRFVDAAARPASTYLYSISARDARGKISRRSQSVRATTPAVASSPPPVQGNPGAFPNANDTGYQNAPGFPGQLKNCNNLVIRDNSTYQFCDFSDGLYIGSSSQHPTNVRFIGCRFASNAVGDANVADYGDGIVFSYDTFEPSTVNPSSEPVSPNSPAIANSLGYQYGIDQRYAGALTVDHSDFWGFAEAIQFGDSSQARPVIISDSWIHNPRDPGGQDHTDGILDNYGGVSYLTINHNSIIGDGNTQALGLQGAVPYDHLDITNNYFSGYGYMLDFGGVVKDTNTVFTGNVWGTNFEPQWGPVYDDVSFVTPSLNNVWSGNTISVAPGTTWMTAGNNRLYWWPDDSNPTGPNQIVGHKTDYPGP